MFADFGARLRSLRKSKKWSMQKLADTASCSKSYIWELENRPAQRPSAATIKALGDALGVSMATLMGEADKSDASLEDLAFYDAYLALSPEAKNHMRKIASVFAGNSTT